MLRSILNYISIPRPLKVLWEMFADALLIGLFVGIIGGFLYAVFAFTMYVMLGLAWLVGIGGALVGLLFAAVKIHEWWESADMRVRIKEQKAAEEAQKLEEKA